MFTNERNEVVEPITHDAKIEVTLNHSIFFENCLDLFAQSAFGKHFEKFGGGVALSRFKEITTI